MESNTHVAVFQALELMGATLNVYTHLTVTLEFRWALGALSRSALQGIKSYFL